MSRMTRENWIAYGIIRDCSGKAAAEEYKHRKQAKNAKYGIRETADSESIWTLVGGSDSGDSYILKAFLSGDQAEEALADFADEHWISLPYPAWDCTGCSFTRCMDFFRVPHGVWVYHHISIDC